MEHMKNLSIGSSTIPFLFCEGKGTPITLFSKYESYLENIENNIQEEEIIYNEAQKKGIEYEKYIIEKHEKLMNIKHEEGGVWNHQKGEKFGFLYKLTVAKPDAKFLQNRVFIPFEAKHTSKITSIDKIDRAHILQVMFQIMCMERNEEKIPYGHYMATTVDEVTCEVVEPIVWARIYRNDELIDKMRELILLFYHDYVFKRKTPPASLISKDWVFPDVIVEDLFKSSNF